MVVTPMTTMIPPSLANQLVPRASSRAEIAFMRSRMVGLGAGVRSGEDGGGVETRAAAAGGIAAGSGGVNGGAAGAWGIAGGALILGGAGGGVGFGRRGGACGAGASGVGSTGFGSKGLGSTGTAGAGGFCGAAGV